MNHWGRQRKSFVKKKCKGILTISITDMVKEKNQMKIFHNRDCMISLMFTLYQNAYVREKQEKYDMATLLLYRLLEMIEQKRLANYGLNVSKMEYTSISYENCGLKEIEKLSEKECLEWLRVQMLNIKKQIFHNVSKYYLPEQISLLDGFILLYLVKDKICYEGKINGIDKLKRIRSMVFLRNNSIFAHGLGPVTTQEFMRFKQFVEEIFMEFCGLENIPFAVYRQITTWVSPFQSQNYSGMEV